MTVWGHDICGRPLYCESIKYCKFGAFVKVYTYLLCVEIYMNIQQCSAC